MHSHPISSYALPLRLQWADDPILQRALAAYRGCQSASDALTLEKLRLLAHYDPPGIQNVVALCHWGRSGSILLPSYLDGHEDVIALPNLTGEMIYPFFETHAMLSIWDKLVVYPIYAAAKKGGAADLLLIDNPAGNYATVPQHYYAAVQALHAIYGERPAEWLQVRARFVQFLHVAYAIANEQQPRNPRPAIIYAQHWFSEELARRFAQDFPQGRFLHTVRDPISALNSWFDMHMTWQIAERSGIGEHYAFPAYDAIKDLLCWDRPHAGMEQRSWALRFEDMHVALEATMQRVADWLGIAYQPSLLESTLNRRPYIFTKGGRSWRGANQSSAQRRCNYLHRCDRALVFALFYQDFVAWGYPVPRALRFRWLRLLTSCACALVPMKIELINARALISSQALPALRSGRVIFACSAPLHLAWRRVRMMALLLAEAVKRTSAHRPTLRLLQVAGEANETAAPGHRPELAQDFRPVRPTPV